MEGEQGQTEIVYNETEGNDIPEELRENVITLFNEAIQKYADEAKIAKHIKTGFDKKHLKSWHCIVSKDLESCVQAHPVASCIGEKNVESHIQALPGVRCNFSKNFESCIQGLPGTHCIEKIGPFTIELWRTLPTKNPEEK